MKRLCICGHKRSNHKYLYCGTILRKRSPCKLCGKNVEVLHYGAVISSPKCNYYKAMDNLQFLELKAQEKSNA